MPLHHKDAIAEVRRLGPRPRRPRLTRSFRLQVMLLVGVLLATMLLTQGAYLNHRKAEIIADQMGERALAVATSVAAIPELVAAFADEDPAATIQPIAERIRRQTGARYVWWAMPTASATPIRFPSASACPWSAATTTAPCCTGSPTSPRPWARWARRCEARRRWSTPRAGSSASSRWVSCSTGSPWTWAAIPASAGGWWRR